VREKRLAMRTSRTGVASATALLVSLALLAPAEAARPPTFPQRVAITRALPVDVRALPAGCVVLRIQVSRNGRFATAAPRFLLLAGAHSDPCLRYASNGYWILQRSSGWKVVFNGSDPPPCSLGVPPDLKRCVP
jgi:hypothetical protein